MMSMIDVAPQTMLKAEGNPPAIYHDSQDVHTVDLNTLFGLRR
jgi:hypothetical protein